MADEAPDSPPAIELAPFALAPRGGRFLSPVTEAAFVRDDVIRAGPNTRTAMVAAIVAWVVVFAIGAPAVGRGMVVFTAFGLFGIVIPVLAISVAIATRPALWRWSAMVQAIANLLCGIFLVVLGFGFELPDLAMSGAITTIFFGLAVLRYPVRPTALVTAAIAAINLILVVVWLRDGELRGVIALIFGTGPAAAYFMGLVARIAIDRSARASYRQVNVIALQRAALEIARERANVADRARELSEALLRLQRAPANGLGFVVGHIVAERYRVVRVLGRGGMGEVYEVERLADAARFALKVMTGAVVRETLARFAREAQLAAELHHPNIVGSLDIGVTEDGTLFLVMELVTGQSLAAARARFGDAAWALPILRGVASALAALHARGIVHRDLKPANILLADAVAKVTDFGLAALVADTRAPQAVVADGDTAAELDPLTQTGAIMGTPMYMAPELAGGIVASGPATDIWSFGVLAFELLANRLPFATPPVTELVVGRTPVPPSSLAGARPELAVAITRAIDRCLATVPADRPTAAALVAVLA